MRDVLDKWLGYITIVLAIAGLGYWMSKDISTVRGDMSNLQVKLGDRISNFEVKVVDRVSNLGVKLGDRMSNLQVKVVDRVSNLEGNLSREIAALQKQLSKVSVSLDKRLDNLEGNSQRYDLWVVESKKTSAILNSMNKLIEQGNENRGSGLF